jgi:hypothetical protein
MHGVTTERRIRVSHDSGFRQGSHHPQPPARNRRGSRRDISRYEERRTRRFHEHERTVDAASKADADEDDAG